ncbi:MAG: PAS domain-containing protein [Actinobacteria bacterium]|nr:PAS domain-containing protein [Actinomycetota bacterium]
MRRLHALRPIEVDGQDGELISFCGHCGLRPHPRAAPPASRVCDHCGLGVVLQARVDVAPRHDQPFLVVDMSLSVCAVSAAAETLFAIDETDAVNRHIGDFLVPADSNAASVENLLTLLVDVAAGSREVCTTVVRPRHEYGVRFWARIGPCGSPRAALLVLS